MNWNLLALVMTGGALGAGARHLLGGWLLQRFGDGLPWGTLAVNLIGSFGAGFLLVWLEGRGAASGPLRAFLVVGVLGGFTTYSALTLEMLVMQRGGRDGAALGYLALTLAGGLLLVWLGARLAESLRG